uniref:Uncharacterized protein n=1 Tax=Leishmania guyanensis TaxID=5670 RepID=A0A1E1J122_LEIGU|nr:hypothetical protein, conserved [Leishmania guyanensis]
MAAATDTTSESLSALVHGERSHRRGIASVAAVASPGASAEEEVTLVYRKPRTRHARRLINADGLVQATVPANYAGAALSTTAATSAAVSTPEREVLAFWHRACGDANRTVALSNCGVSDVAWQSVNSAGACRLSQSQLLYCSGDRMETARRALHNLNDLLYTPADTSTASGAPCVGYPCWVRPEQYAAVVALARVCEAAVPLQLPSLLRLSACPATTFQQSCPRSEGKESTTSRRTSLVWTLPIDAAGAMPRYSWTASSDATTSAPATTRGPGAVAAAHEIGATTIDLVPSPVLLADVQKRLGYIRRLHQLQVAYGALIPAFRAATTVTELQQVVFTHDVAACQTLGRMCQAWRTGHHHAAFVAARSEYGHRSLQNTAEVNEVLPCFLGNPLLLDTLLPFVGITARYPQEEKLLQNFVATLKDMTTIETALWGPVAAMSSWRCTDGLYVVHHASRVHVLRRLLNAAQFYGLPLFLRSIRAMAGSHVGIAVPSTARDGGWQRTAALKRAQSLYADQFFLTPDNLDPDLFAQPDPMQAQLVQEELVTLQRTHCAFCLVVGEADEVLTLMHRHLRYVGGSWQCCVKKEEGEEPSVSLSRVKAEMQDDGDRADASVVAAGFSIKDADETGTASTTAPGLAPLPPRVPTDPLCYYVIRTVDAARRHQQVKASSAEPTTAPALPFSHVQWIKHGSANRWSPNAHYYGLAYMVVLETAEELATEDGGILATEGLLWEADIAMNSATDTSALRKVRVPAYCVNAVLELWRT